MGDGSLHQFTLSITFYYLLSFYIHTQEALTWSFVFLLRIVYLKAKQEHTYSLLFYFSGNYAILTKLDIRFLKKESHFLDNSKYNNSISTNFHSNFFSLLVYTLIISISITPYHLSHFIFYALHLRFLSTSSFWQSHLCSVTIFLSVLHRPFSTIHSR